MVDLRSQRLRRNQLENLPQAGRGPGSVERARGCCSIFGQQCGGRDVSKGMRIRAHYWRPRITTFAVTLGVGQIGEVIPAVTATL
jgi:hypothetical protein